MSGGPDTRSKEEQRVGGSDTTKSQDNRVPKWSGGTKAKGQITRDRLPRIALPI